MFCLFCFFLRRKWRPYAGRRRKNIARHRGLKRNIPTTPVKIIGPPKNRQKAGDSKCEVDGVLFGKKKVLLMV